MSNTIKIDELATKVLEGVKKANRKLIEEAAANNESLVIGEKDGSFKSVPAKEILKTLTK